MLVSRTLIVLIENYPDSITNLAQYWPNMCCYVGPVL